jgi:tRNA(Ile)-lysidine synthase
VASRTKATKIAVGHNADDQTETVLMHFIRGSGLTGLRGMLPDISLDTLRLPPADCPAHDIQAIPRLIRPLLEISRFEIEVYCRQNGLIPRQDSSNQDTTYFRNRLRHELIPQLESYNPNIRQVLRRTAKVIAADARLLAAGLQDTWAHIVKSESPDEIVFDLQGWLALPLGLKRSTLRHAVYRLRHELRDISFVHIENAIKILEKGQTGTQASLLQDLMLTISYRTFTIAAGPTYAGPPAESRPHLSPDQTIELNLPGETWLPSSAWKVVARIVSGQGFDLAGIEDIDRWEILLDADVVGNEPILRTRQPGDRFCPFGLGGHSQKVTAFMINEKIPRAWRNHIPLLVSKGEIWWVCGYRPDERASIRHNTGRVLSIRFERN